MFFVVDVIHQSCTDKISLDKIVDIFPNKNTYLSRGSIVKLSFLVSINIFKSMHFSVFLNAIYLLCNNISVCNNELHN